MILLKYLFIIFAKLRNMVGLRILLFRPARIGKFGQRRASSHKIQITVPVSCGLFHRYGPFILRSCWPEYYPTLIIWRIPGGMHNSEFRLDIVRFHFLSAACNKRQENDQNDKCPFHRRSAFRFCFTAKIDAYENSVIRIWTLNFWFCPARPSVSDFLKYSEHFLKRNSFAIFVHHNAMKQWNEVS